jgi:adenosylcobinamide-GDP ribazoletransferase
MRMPRFMQDIAAALQFLTRLPLPQLAYDSDALSRSAKYFPLIGLALGLVTAFAFEWLSLHLPVTLAALFAVLISVLATGGLHEDGLADAADAFGGGWTRDQVLAILKDSRIGSYGALAIVFSVLVRTLLLAALARADATKYIVSAHVLSRWAVLPLGCLMTPARTEASQGARLARQISVFSVCIGTVMMLGIVGYLLRMKALTPVLAALCVTGLSGFYYRRRIGGITGDCFGATTQLTEIAVYVAAVWHG